jgi:hypothetical protein
MLIIRETPIEFTGQELEEIAMYMNMAISESIEAGKNGQVRKRV